MSTFTPYSLAAILRPSFSPGLFRLRNICYFVRSSPESSCIEFSLAQSVCHVNSCMQIAMVAQEPVLFARTIEENISYGMRLEEDLEMIGYVFSDQRRTIATLRTQFFCPRQSFFRSLSFVSDTSQLCFHRNISFSREIQLAMLK